MARTIQDILKDASEPPRGPGKDSGRGRRTADKGRDAAADGTGTPNTGRYRQQTNKQGVARGQGIVDRAHDPMFRAAITKLDKMQQRRKS